MKTRQANKPEQVYRIVAPEFSGGLVIQDGEVVSTSPTLKRMMGWSLESVGVLCDRKCWILQELKGAKRDGLGLPNADSAGAANPAE